MLWLCLHLPQLPLSALDSDSDSDCPIVDQHGPHRWLITGAGQVRPGTSLAQALMLEPALRTRGRRADAEQAALTGLAHAAYAYGQPVCAQIQDLHEPGRVPRALLWVEIGNSLRLFGGQVPLCDAMRAEWSELGHSARLGVAPTRAGAALLACTAPGAASPPASAMATGTGTATDLQALRAQLDVLPLRVLHWPGAVLHALHGVGLRRLRDLFAVPREAFSQRFGSAYRLALDRLLGDAAEPFEAIVPPQTFRRRFELGSEVEDTERLQFPLKRLCTELQAYLRARDRGLRSVTLAVLHAGARQTRLHAQFVDPHRDARRIFDALYERLGRDGLPLPARELVLIAEDFAAAHVPQTDLFDTRTGQAQAWGAALERIRGRLGESRAWTLQMIEDHRPERGSAACLHTDTVAGRVQAAPRPAPSGLHRPTLLLRAPWPMPAPELPPDAGVERIESGWWDAHDIRRDYVAIDINGARAWVFRDLSSGQWFLHGWFS